MQNGERLGAAHHRFRNVAQLDHDPAGLFRVVAAVLEHGFSTVQTLSATMRAPSAVGMDAVALVQRSIAGDALQQERHERRR